MKFNVYFYHKFTFFKHFNPSDLSRLKIQFHNIIDHISNQLILKHLKRRMEITFTL